MRVLMMWIEAFVLVFGLCAFIQNIGCDSLGENMGLKTKYSIISGCYIKRDGRWIHKNFIRDVNE